MNPKALLTKVLKGHWSQRRGYNRALYLLEHENVTTKENWPQRSQKEVIKDWNILLAENKSDAGTGDPKREATFIEIQHSPAAECLQFRWWNPSCGFRCFLLEKPKFVVLAALDIQCLQRKNPWLSPRRFPAAIIPIMKGNNAIFSKLSNFTYLNWFAS